MVLRFTVLCVYVQCGSTKTELQIESLGIFDLCLQFNVDLRIQWIPRELNDIADGIHAGFITGDGRCVAVRCIGEHEHQLWMFVKAMVYT